MLEISISDGSAIPAVIVSTKLLQMLYSGEFQIRLLCPLYKKS